MKIIQKSLRSIRPSKMLVLLACVAVLGSVDAEGGLDLKEICHYNTVKSTLLLKSASLKNGNVAINKPDSPFVLGKGGFGIVISHTDNTIFANPFAVKVMANESNNRWEVSILYCFTKGCDLKRNVDGVNKEIKIAAQKGDHIPKFLGCHADEKLIFLAEPIFKSKLSWNFIRTQLNSRPVVEKVGILKYLAETVKVLHDSQFIHRDIKPSNILAEDIEVKRLRLIDFGLASPLDKDTIAGSIFYMAPEIWVENATQGLPHDIWSLILSFAEIKFGKEKILENDTVFICVYFHYQDKDLCENAMKERVKYLVMETQPKFELECGQKSFQTYLNFYSQGLEYDPKARLTIDGVIEALQKVIDECGIHNQPNDLGKMPSKLGNVGSGQISIQGQNKYLQMTQKTATKVTSTFESKNLKLNIDKLNEFSEMNVLSRLELKEYKAKQSNNKFDELVESRCVIGKKVENETQKLLANSSSNFSWQKLPEKDSAK
jgi:serine/threonine protein kinase